MKNVNQIERTNSRLLIQVALQLVMVSLMSSPAKAQDAVLQFLLAAEQESENLIPNSSIVTPATVGWFDQAEARFGTGASTGSGPRERQNSYAVRVRPIFGRQRSAQLSLNRLTAEQQELDYQTLLNDALEVRYFALIQMLELQSEIEFHNQQLELITTELEYEQSLVQTDSFDGERLQSLEVEIFQLEQQLRMEAQRRQTLLQESRAPTGLAMWLETRSEWLISHSEMVASSDLETLRRQLPLLEKSRANLQVRNDRLALDMEEEELKRERAERYPPIRFVELKYTDKSQRQGNEAEATLSFSIPFGGRRNAFTKEVRDIAAARTDLLISQRDALRELNQDSSNLQLSVDQLSLINQTLGYIDERLAQSQNIGSPRLILALRKERLQQQRQHSLVRLNAMKDYISLLHTSGQLVTPPLQNWLQMP